MKQFNESKRVQLTWLTFHKGTGHSSGFFRISFLTLRILAANFLLLAIFMFSIFYLNRNQNALIVNEKKGLLQEAQMVSLLLNEGIANRSNNLVFTTSFVKKVMTKYAIGENAEVSLFNKRGKELFVFYPLHWTTDKPNNLNMNTDSALKAISELFFSKTIFDIYKDFYPSLSNIELSDNFKDRVFVWQNQKGNIFFTTGRTILNDNGNVAGIVVITKNYTELYEQLGQMNNEVLFLFLIMLIAMTFFSYYLSYEITRPIQLMVSSAEQLSANVNMPYDIPRLNNRKDDIGRLYQTLKTMTEALKERLNTVEKFSADVAHELKNPLTSIYSAIETLPKLNDKTKQDKLLTIIRQDIQRVNRLISDISMASRLDADLWRLKVEKINIGKMLQDLLYNYIQNVGSNDKQIKFNETQPTTDAYVNGIPSMLLQVFTNIIDNAISFSPYQGNIDIKIKIIGSSVEISISDNGKGIPDGKFESVFNRFYSERADEESFGKHSGLGLSIAKQIVEMHGGRIYARNVVSGEDKVMGACFVIILPLIYK